MRALLSTAPGGPETLELREVTAPPPGPGEVVLRVRACGVNYPDALIIVDQYQFKPDRPFAPGGEVAGEIAAVGDGVSEWKEGDRVIALSGHGGMAEELVVPAGKLLAMPDAMSFEEGACFILTYGTSYHALKQRAALAAGETLLILGAAGGVGLAAIELGKAIGATVVAAVSTQDKLDFAIAHGADSGLIYPRGPFDKDGARALAAQFKEAVGKNGADVVYDAVGGDYAEASLRAIAWQGRFLVVGFPAGIPRIPLNLALLKGCSIVGVFWGAFTDRDPAANAENNRELMEFFLAGKVKPHISASYPLAKGGEAIQYLADRKAMGKVVVTMD